MSYEPHTLDLFSVEQGALPIENPKLSGQAATAKQISYATSIASKVGIPAPTSLFSSSSDLSAWINQYKPKPPSGRFANYPSSKQVAFAERIAHLKRAQVPHECFRDKTLMSRWIDSNKPR